MSFSFRILLSTAACCSAAACGCGLESEQIGLSGQGTLTSSTTESVELFTGGIAGSADDNPSSFDRFAQAKDALSDPEHADTRFGVEFIGVSPPSGVNGRGMLVELAFPLQVGARIEFQTAGRFSLDGLNAPLLQYAEIESGNRMLIPLRSAIGDVVSTEPLSLDLQLQFEGDATLRGSITLTYQRTEICD